MCLQCVRSHQWLRISILANKATDATTSNKTRPAYLRCDSRNNTKGNSTKDVAKLWKKRQKILAASSVSAWLSVFALKTLSLAPPLPFPMAVYTQGYTCRYMVLQVPFNRAVVVGQREAMSPPRHTPPRFHWPGWVGLTARGLVVTLQIVCSWVLSQTHWNMMAWCGLLSLP